MDKRGLCETDSTLQSLEKEYKGRMRLRKKKKDKQ